MDFPIFHLDFAGNRLLIAGIAVLHVAINHALAVGAMPLVTMMELHGLRHGRPDWDRLAYRTLAVCFIITTSVGALTGVGIWFATSLVNPAAIGSLTRVFFGAWFAEWIVFCLEVVAIMTYFLTWKHMGQRHKRAHIALGVGALAALVADHGRHRGDPVVHDGTGKLALPAQLPLGGLQPALPSPARLPHPGGDARGGAVSRSASPSS